jgi:hypothetical protein
LANATYTSRKRQKDQVSSGSTFNIQLRIVDTKLVKLLIAEMNMGKI